MIQLATSPCALVGMPGDLVPLEGEPVPLYLPTLADLFHLDPLLQDKIDAAADAGCWIWTAATVKAGNGRIPYGAVKRQRQVWLAHRWVYVLMVGPIDPDREIHHECTTPLCVNPRHLSALDPDDHDWLHREAALYADEASPTAAKPYRRIQPHHSQPPIGDRAERIRALAELTRTQRTR